MMKNDRSLIPALVEECVRWTSPLLSFMRTAERDYTLRDQTIRKGDWLMLSYPSANRDEDVFEERSEEHTSELQSLMRISSAVFCLKQKTQYKIMKNICTNLSYTSKYELMNM